jgi:glycosyltransferase involved in cell wall biosynthesis
VGAEESLFQPQDAPGPVADDILEVLFYGSFIPLQGPRVIIEAARLYDGPPVRWTLIGRGPQHANCVTDAAGLDNVTFEDWLPYAELPARIRRANILLGVFGNTPKAARVIPNKVFQSLACGRVVITQASAAYPEALLSREDTGLLWVDAGDAHALAQQVARLAGDSARVTRLGRAAAESSREYFSQAVIGQQLSSLLQGLSL